MEYELRCLVCDYMWTENSCTKPCPQCGETNDVFAEERSDDNVESN